MPPLIAAVLLGAGAYAGFRAASHLWNRLSSDPATGGGAVGSRATTGMPQEKDLGPLEFDPSAGVYRPSQRN